MGLEDLVKKIRANWGHQIFVEMVTDPNRMLDVIAQAASHITSDTHRFHKELQRQLNNEDTVLLTLNSQEQAETAFAYLKKYSLPGNAYAKFLDEQQVEGALQDSIFLNNELKKAGTYKQIQHPVIKIAGPTSDVTGKLNNGLIYRHSEQDNYIETPSIAENKQGGLIINHNGTINLANKSIQLATLAEGTALAAAGTSLYLEYEPDSTQSNQHLLESAVSICQTQGYLETYNRRAGFLAQNIHTGEFEYYLVRVSREIAASLIDPNDPDLVNTLGMPIFVLALHQYLQRNQTPMKVAMLEENTAACPQFYYSEAEERRFNNFIPLSIYFNQTT